MKIVLIKYSLLIALLSTGIKSYCQINYKVGDTLSVVAPSGVNLRKSSGTNHEKISKLNTGDLVVVKKVTDISDSIEFNGHWVEVSSVKDSVRGFVFDAFLSKYWIPADITKNERLQEAAKFGVEGFPRLLAEYSKTAFRRSASDIEYIINGYEGAGYHILTITPFYEDCKLISHEIWEGQWSELVLLDARPSESYYLIKSLYGMLSVNFYQPLEINERALMFPMYRISSNCGVGSPGDCFVNVYLKQRGVISINFYYPCC